MAADPWNDIVYDPWNDDNPASYNRVQTTYYSGSYNQITAPSSHNFAGSTRTVIFMPEIINVDDLSGARPFVLRETGGTVLTQYSGSPPIPANSYKLPPQTSKGRTMVEISSSNWGQTFDFDYYGEGSAIEANRYNNILNYSVRADESITAGTNIKSTGQMQANSTTDSTSYTTGSFVCDGGVGIAKDVTVNGGVAAGFGGSYLGWKVVEIGDWNMRTTGGAGSNTKNVNHGLPDFKKIRAMFCVIRNDADSIVSGLDSPDSSSPSATNGGILYAAASQVYLTTWTGSDFDSANYETTSYNRGWVYLLTED
jgi:hypothetical protein